MSRPRARKVGDLCVAVGYVRVSTGDQRLEQQRDAIERWAAVSGVRIVAWCQDFGVSGAAPIDERPGLLVALRALREHTAGVLVAAKRDRLARDVASAAAIERLVQEAGARVVTADGLDSSNTPEGELVRSLIDAMAQYERALIRARTKAALGAKKRRGERVGSIPFGYRSSESGEHVACDPLEQAALARMRELASDGFTQRAIVATLATEGHKPRGQRWHATTVQRALKPALT